MWLCTLGSSNDTHTFCASSWWSSGQELLTIPATKLACPPGKCAMVAMPHYTWGKVQGPLALKFAGSCLHPLHWLGMSPHYSRAPGDGVPVAGDTFNSSPSPSTLDQWNCPVSCPQSQVGWGICWALSTSASLSGLSSEDEGPPLSKSYSPFLPTSGLGIPTAQHHLEIFPPSSRGLGSLASANSWVPAAPQVLVAEGVAHLFDFLL